MPRALEALDHIVRRLEYGELPVLEAAWEHVSPYACLGILAAHNR